MRRDAATEVWTINGAEHSRADLMFLITDWVAEGNSLKMFCDQPGAPGMGTVYKWFKNYPEFERDFRASEEAAAHIMADKALLEVLHTSEREDVPIVKLKYDALTRRAAQMSQKFQDRQVFRQEEDIKSVSDDELKRRKDELMAKVKESLRSEGWTPPVNEIDAEVIEEKDENPTE